MKKIMIFVLLSASAWAEYPAAIGYIAYDSKQARDADALDLNDMLAPADTAKVAPAVFRGMILNLVKAKFKNKADRDKFQTDLVYSQIGDTSIEKQHLKFYISNNDGIPGRCKLDSVESEVQK